MVSEKIYKKFDTVSLMTMQICVHQNLCNFLNMIVIPVSKPRNIENNYKDYKLMLYVKLCCGIK